MGEAPDQHVPDVDARRGELRGERLAGGPQVVELGVEHQDRAQPVEHGHAGHGVAVGPAVRPAQVVGVDERGVRREEAEHRRQVGHERGQGRRAGGSEGWATG